MIVCPTCHADYIKVHGLDEIRIPEGYDNMETFIYENVVGGCWKGASSQLYAVCGKCALRYPDSGKPNARVFLKSPAAMLRLLTAIHEGDITQSLMQTMIQDIIYAQEPEEDNSSE